jgi:hypothetical protein
VDNIINDSMLHIIIRRAFFRSHLNRFDELYYQSIIIKLSFSKDCKSKSLRIYLLSTIYDFAY